MLGLCAILDLIYSNKRFRRYAVKMYYKDKTSTLYVLYMVCSVYVQAVKHVIRLSAGEKFTSAVVKRFSF